MKPVEKMEKRKVTLDDRKVLQLEMLKEIDSFCRANNIKYGLSCGTLIGAIRHQGFIPWDDDVDITMNYADILKFRKIFQSDSIAYCDIDTEPGYYFLFSRLVSKKTYSKVGIHRRSGVCIDLYPIIECTNDREMINSLLVRGNRLFRKRYIYIKWYNRILRYTPFTKLFGFKKAVRNYHDFMMKEIQIKGGGNFYQIGGPIIGKKNNLFRNLWSFNPLEETIDVLFEGISLMVPARYDEFLRTRYGDYMQLPPEEDRYPYHGGNFFWKD